MMNDQDCSEQYHVERKYVYISSSGDVIYSKRSRIDEEKTINSVLVRFTLVVIN